MSYLSSKLCHKAGRFPPPNQENTMAQMIAARHARTRSSAQISLEMDSPTTNTSLGLELGWDHAHYGVTPPVEHLFAASPLRQGWLSGRAAFGQRTLKAGHHVRLWLKLRTHAWARGRAFDAVQVTPNYLQQIAADWCPITRIALDQHGDHGSQRSVDRVRNDAAYAAGNLAMMSRAANNAKHQHDWQSASEVACSLGRGPLESIAGLGAPEWRRIATLCSYVTELAHAQAAALPMLVLPPNRLRLFNPIQALQALITRQLSTPGWSQRLECVEALLPGATLQRDFNAFVLALVPRLLQAGVQGQGHAMRWTLEDAWGTDLVLRRWTQFAQGLSAAQAEQLVTRATEKALSPLRMQQHVGTEATAGWALERQGFQPSMEILHSGARIDLRRAPKRTPSLYH